VIEEQTMYRQIVPTLSEAILQFYRSRGFELHRFVTAEGGLGNNQFLFAKQ
jgi:hypothetical protein